MLYSLLVKIGTAGLGIYFIHFIILNQIIKNPWAESISLWMVVIIEWGVTAISSYLLVILLQKNKYSQLFILGQHQFRGK